MRHMYLRGVSKQIVLINISFVRGTSQCNALVALIQWIVLLMYQEGYFSDQSKYATENRKRCGV
jgi:hypothetical protein